MKPFSLELGAQVRTEGVQFTVWAPFANSVSVVVPALGQRFPLSPTTRGYHSAIVPDAREGMDYLFALDDGPERPDPASRHQPHGVHGASRVVNPKGFLWTDAAWRGLPLAEYVIYELHVGTFTPGGTFEAAMEKLPYLRDLGVTAVQLMPVAQFPGERNWGYDGAFIYAPQNTYGGPAGLKALVNECHNLGMACVLDVVYNHLGPEGTYVGDFGPYFTNRYTTPWGAALNFDGEHSDEVRRYFLDNALHWFSEYHFDALRLDATQCILDTSPKHLLAEMAELCAAEEARLNRPLHLIAESDANDARLITPLAEGGLGLHGQWSEDFHRSLWTALGGHPVSYFADFAGLRELPKALKHGFAYDGRPSVFYKRRRGSSGSQRDGWQFVVFSQNHDQVANATGGLRISTCFDEAKERLAAVVLLTAPNVPLLFMGQEYGETQPFNYFVDHSDRHLMDAVRRGRQAEFDEFNRDHAFADPTLKVAMTASKLDWAKLAQPPHSLILALYKDLLALRQKHPALRGLDRHQFRVFCDDVAGHLVTMQFAAPDSWVAVAANFSPRPLRVPLPALPSTAVVLLASDEPRFGGAGSAREMWPRVEAQQEGASVTLAAWSAVILGPAR
ncbi:MAG: malto-oligosyltrehalose trehalohydrolase [Deltaproteobacteria bacterium]|nr:malto-oligosyltrehalose trehalohydrolase [Deltaproteobacteria bacterium]